MSQPEHIAAAAPEPAAPPLTPAPAARAEAAEAHGGGLGAVQSLCVTVVIAVFVITFLVQAFQIPSESMEDTLLIGDYLLVDKVHYGQGGVWRNVLPYQPIRRGEIIVFRYPVHPSQHFVKRVVGLPGDRLRLVNRRLMINGKPVEERYAIHRARSHDVFRDDFPAPDYASGNVEASWWLQMRRLVSGGELKVPPGQYFVLGDNRDESLDSRYWGFVPRENVIGRPLLIYWSVRSPLEEDGATPPDGKLARFVYVVTHIPQFTRWDRTLRIIE